ncbi:mediator of DNA damage checkpoint protein 1-like isoform X4 [Carettochelys insculpta]|uniref:mediator of DNA damage checkpoint protein 1-like isoform X4 n=1 Tax=Carettochelys insculpta TaxID=44489 RepID=UPI003EBD93F3
MEETQLLEPEDEERHLSGTGDPAGPVGRLHLLGSKYGPERDFWIYPGQTVVGRLPSCGVCLPAPSVSKAHAVIEVSSPDGPHLLYDRGSLNGTRRRRAVLVPHVRYSLTHGDILLFGDVGCQYFLLPPGGADPDDSLEVPPTQPLACPALAIEGTPAPSKRVGYGAVLAQDSEDEEELWGEGRLLHLPGSNGSDSSAEAGARSQATFSSPSANVVPESDEEGGETPHTLRPTPRYKGNPSSPQNGATAGLGGKDPESALAAGCWDLGPDHTQVTSGPPGQRPASPPGSLALGGPVNGRPGQAGSEPEVVDHRGEMPAIEVGSDTDEEEEEEAANRDVQRRRQRAVPGGRDAAGPEVPDGHPEGHGLAGNRDSETEVGQAEDADFALQATQCYLPKEALCSGAKATSAPQAADSGSRLEEEATQTFLLRPPPPVRGSVMSPPAGPALHTPVCSSSEKEEDSEEDPCVADATQSFCEEPGCRSAPPASPEEEEEETQLLLPPPPPEGALSQQQPAVPGQSSGGRLPLGALALPAARPGPEAPGRTLPAGGAGLEPTQGESQPMRLALSASPRPGLALQGEGGRAGAEPRGSSSGHRAQGLSEQGGLEAGGRLEAPATARDLGTEPRTTRDLEVNAEPQPTRDPEAEAETAGNPEPQPTRDPEAEPQPAGDPEAEAQPARDPEAKAEAQRMGDLEAQPQPAGAQAKDAGQVPEAQPSPPAPVRRRSLRSAAPPAPPLPAVGPERRSQRRRAEPGSSQGELPVAPTKPTVAIPARRARRQLCSLALYLDVSEAEQPGPGKRPRRGPGAQDLSPELGAASQGAPGQAQRSRGAAGAEPVPTAKPSTGPGAPGRAQRSRRAAGAEPVPTAEPSTGPGAPGRAQRSRRAAGAEPVPTAEPSTGPGAGELGASQGRARRSQRAPARELAARRRGGPEPAGAAPGEGAGVAASEPPTALENAECGAGKRREALVPPLRRRSSENKAEGLPARATRRSQGPPGGATSPKVLFTGVIDEAGEQVVAALGGALAQSVFDCTHLVTDRVRRTVKFLCALARGVPIVTLDWLDKSGRSSCFLAPSSFLVRDMEREKDFHFSLAQSLKRARRGALLQGYEIHVTPSVKPEPEHMKDIIQCSGGAFLPHMPRAYKDKCIIISCPEDLPRCRPALSAGLPVASAELILTGVLRQALDLAAHRLDSLPAPAPPSAAPTRGSKRKGVSALAPAPTSSAKRRR